MPSDRELLQALKLAKDELAILKERRKEIEEGKKGGGTNLNALSAALQRQQEEKKKQREKDKIENTKNSKEDAEEMAKLQQGFEDEQLRMKEEAHSKSLKEFEDFLEDGIQLELDIEQERQQEILSINEEYFDLRMQDENEFHREKITLLENQKMIYPQLESEINALIAAENKRHRDHELSEEDKLLRDRIRNAEEAFSAIGTINGALMAMGDARTQRQIKNLENENLSQEEFEKRKEELLKEGEEKRRAFARVQQGIAIAEATINAIKAGTGALADTPGGAITRILSMGAAIAAGFAEVYTIQKQHFQVGRIGQNKRGRQVDNISAFLGQGETVVPAPQSAAHEDTLRAIVNNTANTAAGVRSMGRGDTIQIYGASNEQILNVINAQKRKRSVGLRI